MLLFKTKDELVQIKHFLLTYYLPILSKIDVEQFENDIEVYSER